jgi:signal peptidase II
VVKSIPLYQRIPVIPGFFDLTYVQNTGAAFSIFEGMGIWFFVILTFLILAAMVYAFWKSRDLRIEICLALIMAGAIGNLIDRIEFGYVRDFFLFYIFGSPFPVFNVADICITVGFIGLVIFYLLDDWKESRMNKAETAEEHK